MSSNLTAQSTLARNAGFVERIRAAIVAQAKTVMDEGDAIPGHAARASLAQRVLADSSHWANEFASGIQGEPNIDEEALDSHIQIAVDNVWNAYAGVE